MNRKILGIVLAVLIAGLGAFVISRAAGGGGGGATVASDGSPVQLPAEEMRGILVVDRLVPKGTPVSSLALAASVKEVPVRLASSEALATLEGLEEKVTAIDLKPGDQVFASRLVEPGLFSRLVAPVDVPDGLLQMAISLEPERALGGQLRAGDTIAVAASFAAGTETKDNGVIIDVPASTHIILHKVLVTQVQSSEAVAPVDVDGTEEVGAETDPRELTSAYLANLTVTVAVTHEQASKLVFARENAQLWLISEPDDAPEEELLEIQTRRTVNR